MINRLMKIIAIKCSTDKAFFLWSFHHNLTILTTGYANFINLS